MAAKTVERDERVWGAAGVAPPRAENLSAGDSLDIGDWELSPCPEVENDELVGGDGRVGEEVRARIDRGRVEPEVSQDGGRRDVDARSPCEVLLDLSRHRIPGASVGQPTEPCLAEGSVELPGNAGLVAAPSIVRP